MKRERIGQLLFLGAAALAAALYVLTAPSGLPWNESTRLAERLGVGGGVGGGIGLGIWGFHVRVVGGAVALAILSAALSAGLLAALVNRYFGWRFASALALVWIFLPVVWNRAITGERGICLAAAIVAGVWVLNAVTLWVLRRVRAIQSAGGPPGGRPLPVNEKRQKANRIAGWVALGAAGVFAVVSLSMHDYLLGEAASVYARGVVEEAGEKVKVRGAIERSEIAERSVGLREQWRIIVMNGVCDEQVERELEQAKVRGEGEQRNLTVHSSTSTCNFNFRAISLRDDDAYRKRLADWAKSAFPAETNLWMAAQVGAAAFLNEAMKAHPERFYLMNGKSTTLEQWKKRWADFKPYAESSDPFAAVGRRLFGYEGNAVANAMQDGEKGERGENGEKVKVKGEGEEQVKVKGAIERSEIAERSAGLREQRISSTSQTSQTSQTLQTSAAKQAWQLYKRIYEEIDPGNMAALVNMSEMIRRGYAAGSVEKKAVQERLDAFFADPKRRKHARELVRAAGPVRADAGLMEKMAEEAKKRIAARIAAGEKVELPPEVMSLIEWNNEMCQLMDAGELAKAGRIARKILSNPQWQGFLSANAVLGTVSASEGDYAASEQFYKVALDTTNAVPAVVLNDYADTLMCLGKADEAEKVARRAVEESDERFWLARLTLAEILEKKAGKLVLADVVENGEKTERYVKVEGADKMEDEVRALLKTVLKYAPPAVRDRVRQDHRKFVR